MDKKVYATAIDAWLIVVLLSVPVVMGWFVLTSRGPTAMLIHAAMFVVVIGSMAAMVFPCRYTLYDDHLHIRCGLIQSKVPYAAISSVELSNDLTSAPALSLRRVKIKYGRKVALISPKDREAFIDALKRRIG